MSDENEKLKKLFEKLSGRNIVEYSIVVKMGDKNFYRVIGKDRRIVECVKLDSLFGESENAKSYIFEKNKFCNYFLLAKEWEKIRKKT